LAPVVWPDNGGTMPGERNTFTRSSILVRPHSETALSALQAAPAASGLVEAPGTAPGSDTLIPSPFIAIAGASSGEFNIVATRRECKVCTEAKPVSGGTHEPV